MTEKSKKKPCKFYSNPSKSCELIREVCERAHSGGIFSTDDECYIFKIWRDQNE